MRINQTSLRNSSVTVITDTVKAVMAPGFTSSEAGEFNTHSTANITASHAEPVTVGECKPRGSQTPTVRHNSKEEKMIHLNECKTAKKQGCCPAVDCPGKEFKEGSCWRHDGLVKMRRASAITAEIIAEEDRLQEIEDNSQFGVGA